MKSLRGDWRGRKGGRGEIRSKDEVGEEWRDQGRNWVAIDRKGLFQSDSIAFFFIS